MSVHEANPATMSPLEFARLVKKTPSAELRRMLHSDRRTPVLDVVVGRMPEAFRADRAGSIAAVIHWNVGDRPDGGTDVYEFIIADGGCALSSTPTNPPDLTLTLGAVDFLNLVTGNTHAVILVMRGKLKTKGDLALTAKFPSLFDTPKP